MAVRRQNISPAAKLLRNSRLFSLPNPLPRPEASSVFTGTTSNSATLPYPTHQAIATTKSSLARGDWGLKRPIPSRSRIVQTSNPVLKVTQLDTIEHITDYDSASDHVRTREKWEELDIPIMRGMHAMRDTGLYDRHTVDGAFDRRSDVTSYENNEGLDDPAAHFQKIKRSMEATLREEQRAKRAKAKNPNAPDAPFVPFGAYVPDAELRNVRRWKHEGPWLPGMSSADIMKYITKQLDPRKEEFHRILVHYVKNDIYTARNDAFSKNETLPLDEAEAAVMIRQQEKKWSKFTQEEIDAGIKELRKEAALDPLKSKLFQHLVGPFLRLPTFKFKDASWSSENKKQEALQRFDDSSVPLSTHPSAGLGYLRTTSHMMNHPILGPQAKRQPVTARVLQPRTLYNSNERHARLGIGGFVTNDPEAYVDAKNINRKMYTRKRGSSGTDVFDEVTYGGAKVELVPQFASVDIDGRIHLATERAHGAEILVKRGHLMEQAPVQPKTSNPDLIETLTAHARNNGTTLGADSVEAKSMQRMMQELNQNAPRDNANLAR